MLAVFICFLARQSRVADGRTKKEHVNFNLEDKFDPLRSSRIETDNRTTHYSVQAVIGNQAPKNYMTQLKAKICVIHRRHDLYQAVLVGRCSE